MEVVHTIIKEEKKGMELEELKALTIQEKSNLFAAIDEGRIHTDLMEDLIIFEDQSWNQSLAVSKSESYKIFKEILCLKSFDRKKRSRYTKSYRLTKNPISLSTLPQYHKKMSKNTNRHLEKTKERGRDDGRRTKDTQM